MKPNTGASISIWRQAKLASRADRAPATFPTDRHAIHAQTNRMPVSSLTAGQGKIRLAG